MATILFLGGLTLGLATAATLSFNGFVIGYAVTNSGRDLSDAVLALLPHGILEIPAFVLAGAAGFWLPYSIARYFVGTRDELLTASDLWISGSWFVLSCLFLVVAAWLEAVVTPMVAPV